MNTNIIEETAITTNNNDLDIMISGKNIMIHVSKRFYQLDKDADNLKRILMSLASSGLYNNITVRENNTHTVRSVSLEVILCEKLL